jgi:hypothetical protein
VLQEEEEDNANIMLKRICGPKAEEVTGRGRKLPEELRNLYSSVNIIRMIKSRTMRRDM